MPERRRNTSVNNNFVSDLLTSTHFRHRAVCIVMKEKKKKLQHETENSKSVVYVEEVVCLRGKEVL